MALLRPIGKSTKIALFQKETTEGVFIDPLKEVPFKSCDVKKTMKTEEDSSNIGEVFTTELITMGYDIQGNIEMNIYPESIGDIAFFSLGKSLIGNTIKGVIGLKYVGDQMGCRYQVYNNAGVRYLRVETYNGTTWTILFNIEIQSKTISQIKTAIEGATSFILCFIDGTGTGLDANVMANPVIIKMKEDNILGFFFLYKSGSIGRSHNIWASNSVLDGIPSFSMIIDKNYGINKIFGYSGCKINTLGLSFAIKTFVTASISIRAKEEYDNKTDLSTDFQMTNPYVTNNSIIYINGVEFNEIKDLKIDINNNMFIDEAVGVNTYNSQDRQGATINISGTANLTIEENNRQATQVLNEKYIKNEPIDLFIICNTNLYIDTDTKYLFYIYIPKIKLSDGTTTIGGAERLTLSFSGQAVKSNLYNRHIEFFVNNTRTTNY